MKVLLINQNPVIKKLVGMASKKLNLEVENVARIAPDFNASNYICIIVDDENVGKNLERLTALQDQVKVCLLFARQTQIKKHEFNIAIQKPFLPTDILEILNDCIPKEGEINKTTENKTDSIDTLHDSLAEYDDIDNINEIDMDLKSAEITPPDGIDIDSVKLQKEAEQIANEDTESMLDFNPDSLDFSNLEGVEAAPEAKEDNKQSEDKDSKEHLPNVETESKETSEDRESDEVQNKRVGSIFDSDLSDLKPSDDNPLDLANFDLDSIMDASALKAASLGIPSQMEEEAKDIANSFDGEDDLFLDDDEREMLQPSPKKFMQAQKEEEERKAKGLSEGEQLAEQNLDSIHSSSDASGLENKSEVLDSTHSLEELEDKNESLDSNNYNVEGSQDSNLESKEDFSLKNSTNSKNFDPTNRDENSLDSMDTKNVSNKSHIESLEDSNLQIDAQEIKQSMESSQTNSDTPNNIDLESLANLDEMSKDSALQSGDKDGKKAKAIDTETIDQDLEQMGLTDSLQNTKDSKKDDKPLQEDIDLIDLSGLDETLKMQSTQKDHTETTLDDAFDDLTAALNSAFENMTFDMDSSDNKEVDSKNDLDKLDLDSLDSLENVESLENIDNAENNLESLDTESKNDIDNELNLDSLELTDSNKQKEDSDLEALLQTDMSQVDNEVDSKLESSENDLDIDSILNAADNVDLNTNDIKTQELTNETAKKEVDSKNDLDKLDLESLESDSLDTESKNSIDDITLDNLESIEAKSNENDTNVDNKQELDLDSLDSLENVESLENIDNAENNLESLDTESKNDIDNELNLDSLELTDSNKQKEDSDLEALLQTDMSQVDNEVDSKLESSENDLDIDSILNAADNVDLNLEDTQSGSDELSGLNLQDAQSSENKEHLQDELMLDTIDESVEDESAKSLDDGDSNTKDKSDDIDLDSMLDTFDLTQEENPKKSVIPQEMIEEVNEALLAINDDADIDNSKDIESNLSDKNTDTSLSFNNDDTNDLFADLLNDEQLDSKTLLDIDKADSINMQDTLLDDASKTESMQNSNDINVLLEDTSGLLSQDTPLDDTKSSESTQQDKDTTTKKEALEDMQSKELEQHLDSDTLYVTLPSNEDNIEKLTETELAEALGESELPIMRLEQSLDTESISQDKKDNAESMQTIENSNIETTAFDNAATIDTLDMQNAKLQQSDIKDLDANSLIDLFKNTPTDKLHEIFDGSEITFNIRFSKNS